MAAAMDGGDMEWLVDSRSEVQNLLLVLWHIAKEAPPSTPALQLQHQLLIAACFALWRAVFLAHGERSSSVINADATKFLETLVRDNAIAYAQDRESKAWTFGYYVNDAYFRLEYFHKTFHKLNTPHAERVTAYLKAQGTEAAGESDAHVAWTHAYEAALDAANVLASKV